MIIFLLLSLTTPKITTPIKIILPPSTLTHTQDLTLTKSTTFQLQIDPKTLQKNQLFLILESNDLSLTTKIYDTTETDLTSKNNVILSLKTLTGNTMMIMSDTYFNGNFDFIKKNGNLFFSIKSQKKQTNLKLKIFIGNSIDLDLGKSYTTRYDQLQKETTINWKYNGLQQKFKKLRFQVMAIVNKDTFTMKSFISYKKEQSQMNYVFRHLLGGILDDEVSEICREEICIYKQKIFISGVKKFNLESELVQEIQQLSIFHYEEYYDKVYSKDSLSHYILKYDKEVEGMDISINLIPVVGNIQLYVNVKSKPVDLEKYNYKEIGPLAKRITIKYEELVQMKATESDLYITVHSTNKGEFLLKIDAHEQHYRGRLSSGVQEAGFIKFEELASYLYTFDVYQTQDIEFTSKLQVFSGEANLYLKQCFDLNDCKVELEDLNSDFLLKVENKQIDKEIIHQFECKANHKHSLTQCNFLLVVHGKENHGTHFELSISENRFHTLMTPGHIVNVSLLPDQIKYFKFSNPGQFDGNSLFLSIEPLWGSFQFFMDKNNKFPYKENFTVNENFHFSKHSLLNSLKTLSMADSFSQQQGVYYISLKGETSSKVGIKFIQKSENKQSLHTLSAGSQLKGTLNKNEILYYTIKVSLETDKANTISIDLVPLRGKFIMFAQRNSKLPTKNYNEVLSLDNHLDLLYKNYEQHHEYIIGVQSVEDKEEQSQFRISLNYSDKPNKLLPGVLSTYTVKDKNNFVIEVLQEMQDLLILKTVNDGYNMIMCSGFKKECDRKSEEKRVSIYYNKKDLKENCIGKYDLNEKCFLYIKLNGYSDQKYTIGFSYNQQPFHLVKEQVITGPGIVDTKKDIKFIYHVDLNSDFFLMFNARGRKMSIYNKLVDGDSDFKFPDSENFDNENSQKKGHFTVLTYQKSQIQKMGKNPELLITIKADEDTGKDYDQQNGFLLQAYKDSKEILRTHVHTQHQLSDTYYYYNLYNNGNSDYLKIYVNTDSAAMIEVCVSKGKNKPPFDTRPLIKKTGVSSVEIDLKQEIIGKGKTKYMGYYTVAVKTVNTSLLHIYWNNKSNLNYLELTPNIPSTMTVDKEIPLYFQFYSEKNNKQKDIAIHWRGDVQVDMFILKSESHELLVPSALNFNYKDSLGKKGGVSVLKINPKSKDYCMSCSYIGILKSQSKGKISLLVNLEHQKIPIKLSFGNIFPENLKSHKGKTYRFLNAENEDVYINISMMSGKVNLFIGDSDSVSSDNNKQFYFMNDKRENQKFIKLNPELITNRQQDIYIRIENPMLDSAQFTIELIQNKIHSPVQQGISKQIELSSKQKIHLYYDQKNENEIEVRLILKKVETDDNIEQALQNIDKVIRLTYLKYGKELEIQKQSSTISENVIYYNYDVSGTESGHFTLELQNPNDFGISVNFDVISGKYKLLNMYQQMTDFSDLSGSNIYETYGNIGSFWFMELKMCLGKTNVSFYQSDYQNLQDNKFVDYKTVEDNNSFVHYFKLTNHRIFIKLENDKVEKSFFQLSFYGEEDINSNPYQEVTQQSNGRVKVMTDTNKVVVDPIQILNFNSSSQNHKLIYKLFLTTDFKVMRYLKNCSDHLIQKAFDNPNIHYSFTQKNYSSLEKLNNEKQISIDIPKLDKSKKYYGIVVVDLQLFPNEEGWMEPIRQSKAYYDEFIYVSRKMQIPFNMVTYILLLVSGFVCVYLMIKSYVFSDLDGEGSLIRFKGIGDSVMGFDCRDILESEFVEEKEELELDGEGEGVGVELGDMDDKTAPLDLDM